MRRVLAAAASALLFALPSPARAQPPVWVVRDADSTIVLFGSIHVLPQGLDWRPPALGEALAKADDLWFEIPIDIPSQVEGEHAMQQRGLLPASDSLFNHLTPEQAARLRRVCRSLSLSEDAVARMEPWFAEVTLSFAMDLRVGASASDGVEQQVQAAAPPAARRRAFESVAQQVGFLAGAPRQDQVASLNETLTEIEERPDAFDRIVADWMRGDVAAIESDALAPLARSSPGLYRRLITERNRRWTKTIRRRLAGSGVTVVVVGAGHLVGPGGVPALLRAAGVHVEGP